VLGFCVQKSAKRRTKSADELSVLAVGNPDLDNPRYDLPFAEREIASVARTYEHVETYVRKDATERVVKQKASNADLLLLSCHGEYDDVNPLFSGLLLAPDSRDDGRLEVHEIFGLDLKASLITLSACETGLGKVTGGDDVIGLSRGFIFAGAPSIIASLWKVDDVATAVTIKRLYRYLEQQKSKAESLRQAQLVVKERVNSHPAYWASFYLTGAW
jgi:CHAT domain-containing protein